MGWDLTNVSATLQEQGIRLRATTAGSYKTQCPQCSHTRKNRRDPCLSVTIDGDGVVFNCHHCGYSGGSRDNVVRPQFQRREYTQPKREPNPQRPDKLIEWFGKRGISAATVEHFGIYRTKQFFPQTGDERDCIAFPYEWREELRNVKYRTADKHFRQEKNPEPVLFNADSIDEGQDLIWVEGEMDVLSIHEAGFPHVVSLPNGAPAKPEESDRRYEPLGLHWDDLKNVRRHLIATDLDEPGERLANELARRLGKDKCFRVRFTHGKDSNECLVEKGAAVLRADVGAAEPWPIDGLYDVSAYEQDLLDLFHGRGPRPQTTGFAEFDKAFRFLPGQFIVVTGIPNHGKSRFLDQVACQTAQYNGDVWAIFSPETGETQHIADLCEIRVGAHFFDGPSQRMSEAELLEAKDWVNRHFVFISSGDHTPTVDWVIERAKAAVVRYGIKHLIADPYNEFEAGRPSKQTETEFVSQFISKLKRFGRNHECTVWIVAHPTKMQRDPEGKYLVPGLYDISGSAHWNNKADAGIVVYRDYEDNSTLVLSKKIRRQPICGTPGGVKFAFVPHDRRFHEVRDSYQKLSSK